MMFQVMSGYYMLVQFRKSGIRLVQVSSCYARLGQVCPGKVRLVHVIHVRSS
jgi:hypothetical protein